MSQVKNLLNPLGRKIFLDRYALKDGKKETLAVNDTVIVVVNKETGQREIGTVVSIKDGAVSVKLEDDTVLDRAIENIDKPVETDPSMMMERVARSLSRKENDKTK